MEVPANVQNWPASDRSPAMTRSNLGLLRHLEGIVDLGSQVANRAFQLCAAEQQLHRPKVLRPPVDQRSFRAAPVEAVRRSVFAPNAARAVSALCGANG